MKLSNQIMSFSQGETSLYEKFADYMAHYRATAEGVKGLVFDNRATLDAKEKELNGEILAEVEKCVGRSKPENISFAAWATDPVVKHYTFAVIGAMIDAILPETLIDSIGVYADIRYGGFGDSFAFDVESRDLFAVSQAGNGKRLGFVKKQFKGTETLVPVNHKITVQVSVYRMLAGLESLAKFTMKAVRSIETQMTYDAYDAMAAGLNALSGNAASLKVASYSQDALVSLCQKVTAYNGGNKAVIVGTQLALSKVLPSDSNYRYMLDSQYVTLGHVTEFNGFDVMAIPQVADYSSANYGLKLNDNILYVISPSADKLIKIAVEGETLAYVDEIDDNANLTQNSTINKRWQAGMITSAIAGQVTLA